MSTTEQLALQIHDDWGIVSDSRSLKSISARYDIDVSRQSNRLRRLRSRVTKIAFVVAVIVSLSFLFGDHRSFESRPVSNAHHGFERNCQACHTQSFSTLHRLATFDNQVHSVTDQACQQCHAESSIDHVAHADLSTTRLDTLSDSEQAALEQQFTQLGCVGCHQEHRGLAELKQVRDVLCVTCHLDQESLSSPFELQFDSFFTHPELAIYRESSESDSSRHRSLALTSLVDGKRRDASNIKFNHHRHLDPELPNADRKVQQLNCQDCHVLDAERRDFQPITFEQHCQSCHQLGFRHTGPLPHESPDMIRGILMDRLARTQTQAETPRDLLGGPTKPPQTELPSTDDKLAALQLRLQRFDELLFGTESSLPGRPADAQALLESACSKCHHTQQNEAGDRVRWSILPPQIPQRWLPHHRFRHDSHDTIGCAQCHSQGGSVLQLEQRDAFYPELSAEQHSSPSIFASRTSADLLMPRIAVCQQCHGQSTHPVFEPHATSDCVTCHSFHHTSPAPQAAELMQQFIQASGK